MNKRQAGFAALIWEIKDLWGEGLNYVKTSKKDTSSSMLAYKENNIKMLCAGFVCVWTGTTNMLLEKSDDPRLPQNAKDSFRATREYNTVLNPLGLVTNNNCAGKTQQQFNSQSASQPEVFRLLTP
jgi:hypothetical protein